ncbi:hypothetical protein SEA_RAVENCO17_31 [Gordonia phage RavenCo17]|nr:hypothetical protein SEA_RAVENCO17_31 [Gordonia phage RavenCo17]
MLLTDLPEGLRQGDICSVSAFPRWTAASSSVLVGTSVGLMVEAWDKPIRWTDDRFLVAICSYDCDVENPRARSGILLAPVMPMPAKAGSDREEEILSSNVAEDGKISYVNLFPLCLPRTDGTSTPAVVDFSAVASMSSAKDAVTELKEHRHFSLASQTREEFQIKAALNLYRAGE